MSDEINEMLAELQEKVAALACQIYFLNYKKDVEDFFISTFGEEPMRAVRAPGRVNLRGMHVDTHGGWLNLMCHQREILVVFAPTNDGRVEVHNTDANFEPVSFDMARLQSSPGFALPWEEFVAHTETQSGVESRRGKWDNYILGAASRVMKGNEELFGVRQLAAALDGGGLPPTTGQGASSLAHTKAAASLRTPKGMLAVVSGDIPRGAALSSSHALSVAMLMAYAACQDYEFSDEELILASRDVEWFTGARTGLSDQAAIVLGKQGKLLRVALLAEDFSIGAAEYIDFPEALDLIVVHSHTSRNLSGKDKLAYTKNRFAYSLAFDVLRQILTERGMSSEEVATIDRLSNMSPERFGGVAAFYRLLQAIPQEITLKKLKNKYKLPHFEESFTKYFGGYTADELPESIMLRGPLLFGISESERARGFARLLVEGLYAEAGRMMSVGHDGDRVRDAAGNAFEVDLSDSVLERYAAEEKPVAECCGYYGASSPVLDLLVDTALAAGALGASLTGAGIAGSVLVLCEKEKSPAVMETLRAVLGSSEYAKLAKLPETLRGKTLEDAVMINCAVDGAGYVEVGG